MYNTRLHTCIQHEAIYVEDEATCVYTTRGYLHITLGTKVMHSLLEVQDVYNIYQLDTKFHQ